MKVTTIIRAKKDLYNGGKCFTQGKEYAVIGNREIHTEASLMEATTTNDQKQAHVIGSWWREFEILDEMTEV